MSFLPIFITYDRFPYMDYTFPVTFFPIIFVTRAPNYIPDWTSLTRPFTIQIWIAIISSMFIFGLILHQIIQKDFSFENNDIRWSRSKICWYLFASFTYQGFDINPIRRFPSRLLVGVWWLSIVVLVSSYSGTLKSFLTYPVAERVPTNFDELKTAVQDGYYSCGSIKDDGVSFFILQSKSGNAKFLGDHMRSTNNLISVNQVTERLMKGRFAFIYIGYLIDQIIKSNEPNTFITSSDSLETFASAYPIRKGFLYRKDISKM
ncbi:glutamate receptor-like [Centruroides vittatus]|uniref:glutamate receptor-like n=1 Tax=Centruroides vittatus TaxID=120091 RepID=UPI00350FCF86